MVLTDNWFTALSDNEDGTFTFISGRTGIEAFVDSHKFPQRIEVTWTYSADEKGLPVNDQEAEQMEEVGDLLRQKMEKDKLAILTGVYTGQGQRIHVFIARNVEAFGRRLNEALADFPQLPLSLYVEHDPDNQEYHEMQELKGEED